MVKMLAAIGWLICLPAVAVELPSESTLPAPFAAPAASLPDESALPPMAITGVGEANAVGETGQASPEQTPRHADPGVDPNADPAAGTPDLEQRLPLGASPDAIAWLRLNGRGHAGPVRTLCFAAGGQQLLSAGDDKAVIVWTDDPQRDGVAQYLQSIRWQVQRGARGRIYAMAAAGEHVAFGGHGAMGGVGEILLVDPATGGHLATLFDEAAGHRQVVVAIDAVETPTGTTIASQSMDGRTLLWRKNQQGLWKANVARADDRTRRDPLAPRLLTARSRSGVVAANANEVIVGLYDGVVSGRLAWRLARIDVSAGTEVRLGGPASPVHVDAVAALAADATRNRLASVDGTGRVFLWDLSRRPAAARLLPRSGRPPALSATLSPDGRRLAVGTVATADQKAMVEWWDIAQPYRPRPIAAKPAGHSVLGIALTNEGRLGASDRRVVLLWQGPGDEEPQKLQGNVEMPQAVAFPRRGPAYHLGIGVGRGQSEQVAIDRQFDTDRLQLDRVTSAEDRWLPPGGGAEGWSIGAGGDDPNGPTWRLTEQGRPRARLPLRAARTGGYSTAYWLPPDADGEAPRVLIGTTLGDIYLLRRTAAGEAPVLRRFRGHTSVVRSLAVSRDARYMASAADDGTVRIWPLDSGEPLNSSMRRWGAEFAVENAGDDQRGGLRIATLREDGPLYFRGARHGDQIVRCRWQTGGQTTEAVDPRQIAQALRESPWNRLMEFQLQSGQEPARRLLLLPAWQPLASLTADERGEWAYWTPSGFYDASFEGHRLFGWQVNRGLARLPDYFLAAQFRGVLERPAVMSQLLRSGSLERAFRAVGATAPDASGETLVRTYRQKPEVTIVPPSGGATAPVLREEVLTAQVRYGVGQQLARVKAFAGGVVAPPGKVIDQQSDGKTVVATYRWKLAVPSDERLLLQVVAATDREIVGSDQLVVANEAPRTDRQPTLYFFAAAVDEYRDAQIPKLSTPVGDAQALTALLQSEAARLYRVEATALTDDQVTRPSWRFMTEYHAAELRERATPDDLLIIYLSGHGLQDPESDQFHFVTADATYREIAGGSYAHCLSFGELSQFADVSCRKLVILDTCHGGAIQPLRHRELKRMVRTLQGDQLLTLAASQGAQEAVEGRFAKELLAALRGRADEAPGNSDGVVTLDELVADVQRAVEAASEGEPIQQSPSAGPTDLLPYVRVPLIETRIQTE